MGQDRKILDRKDAAEECMTPEVQKYAYGVRFQSLMFQKLDKLKNTTYIHEKARQKHEKQTTH